MGKIRVNYKSDLPPVQVKFKINDAVVDVPDHDFIIRFFVEGSPGTSFVCSYKDGEYVNCQKVTQDTLVCYVDNHHFGCGRLCCEFIDLTKDRHYEDGVMKTVTPSTLDVVLVDGVGDDTVEVLNAIFKFEPNEIENIVANESQEDGGTNTITITQTNGEVVEFGIKNGKTGAKGDTGAYRVAGEVVAPDFAIVNDLTTGGETDALSAEMGKELGESVEKLNDDVYSSNYRQLALVRTVQNAYLVSNRGAIYTGNMDFILNIYEVEAGKTYNIHIANGTASTAVYLYNFYATLADAKAGTNALGIISIPMPAQGDITTFAASTGAHYMSVSFARASTYSVDAGEYATNFEGHEERIATLEDKVEDLDNDVFVYEPIQEIPILSQEGYLLVPTGERYENNAYILNTYEVEEGKTYYIHIANGEVSPYVYLYKWYGNLTDATNCENALTGTTLYLPAQADIGVDPPEGAHYLNVTFKKSSTYSVDAGEYNKLSRIDGLEGRVPAEPATIDVERANLFDQAEVLEGYVMDTTSGRMSPFTQNGYCYAVAKVPAIKGKYYCIYNPYYNDHIYYTRVGVLSNNGTSDWGNYNQNNIVVYDTHWIVAQAIYNTNTDAAVDHISFQLYWGALPKPNYQDTPLVEVYEMASADEAIEFIRLKNGQTMKISPKVSIDEAMLASNVATLGSVYDNKSVVIFGDSISANHAWSDYMMNKLKLRNLFNFSIGGASIQYNRENLDLLSQINDVATRMSATCYLQGTLQDGVYVYPVDCVMICLGHNDVGGGSGHAIGDFATVRGTSWESLAPTGTLFTSGILAAFKYCLFLMKTTIITSEVTINGNTVTVGVDFRNAKFIYQSPIQTTKNDSAAGIPYTYAQLRAAMKEICEYYSVIYIDGWTRAGINKEEELIYQSISGTTYGKNLKDGIHPTEVGYIKLGEMMTSALISNFM